MHNKKKVMWWNSKIQSHPGRCDVTLWMVQKFSKVTEGDVKHTWALRPSCRRSHTCKRRMWRQALLWLQTQSCRTQKWCRLERGGRWSSTDHHRETVYVKNPAKLISHCQMEPSGKKNPILKHTLLSSSITDRRHKRAICQIPYALKKDGKDLVAGFLFFNAVYQESQK